MPQESPIAISLALLYELVSILSSIADTEDDAVRALEQAVDLAREQIAAYGVGRPHP